MKMSHIIVFLALVALSAASVPTSSKPTILKANAARTFRSCSSLCYLDSRSFNSPVFRLRTCGSVGPMLFCSRRSGGLGFPLLRGFRCNCARYRRNRGGNRRRVAPNTYRCGTIIRSSGEAFTQTYTILMGRTSGFFIYSWNFYDNQDRLTIFYRRRTIAEVPFTPGRGTRSSSYAGPSSTLTVVVVPPGTPSVFDFVVQCPTFL